jgi:hypothetical protein
VEGVVGEEHARTPGGLPRELDRRFDRFGSRVAEEHPVDVVPAPLHQLFRQQAGEEGAVHLHHVREVEIDGLVEGGLQRRMAASEGIDPEAGEEVQVPISLGIEEVGPLTPDIEAVEPDRLEHAGQLEVQVLVV